MKGCPLHCAWCHNPEGRASEAQLLFAQSKCVLCGDCMRACIHGVHTFDDKGMHRINASACVGCRACENACAYGALEVAGREMTAQEVIDQALRDRPFYGDEGGLTLTGGEPLSQPEFLLAIASLAFQEKLHPCIETCGYGNRQTFMALVPFISWFLFDYKLTDDAAHRKWTGVSNKEILDNLSALSVAGAHISLRCPLIPEVNTIQEHYMGIARTAETYSGIQRIELEPYHPLGIDKYARMGAPCPYPRREEYPRDQAFTAADIIRRFTEKPVIVL